MGRELGRISGPLLKDDLLRNGKNLAFETNLLYFDVVNKRVGFKSISPTTDLFVQGTLDTPTLIVDNTADIGNFVVSGSQIQQVITSLTISPSQQNNPTVVVPSLTTPNFYISGNTVTNTTANSDIVLVATGTGQIKLNNDTLVSGDLHATGNITFDGNVQLGDQTTDTITITAEVNSNILPILDNTYNLGSPMNKWATVYSDTITPTTITTSSTSVTTLISGNIKITGNTVSNTNTSNDISVAPSGTGVINVNGAHFDLINGNVVTNTSNNAFILASTGQGYTKFTGSNGFVIPTGTSSNYPATAHTGQIRYNTEQQIGEVYNGTTWTSVIGTSATVTLSELESTILTFQVVLGF
jgi:hypothetical protein